ncbi:MAG TPA: chromate efflux transporter [Actinomycetota bacterium]|nr:chromate efflux transporter [Actinomycetota bacterium]
MATRLGLTSFGGPVAHLGYFRAEYVGRLRWVDEPTFADLVALSQFLPGPASSKLGMAIGILRAGIPGALAAWLGFTLPSAALLVAFAFGAERLGPAAAPWLHGLKVVAVAVVSVAVWSMAKRLAYDRARGTFAIAAAVVLLAWPSRFTQLAVIAAGGVAGALLLKGSEEPPELRIRVPIGRRPAAVSWVLLVSLLALLPWLRQATDAHSVEVFDSFYRSGALVFGGGHVVLPLLRSEVVAPGWVSKGDFLAGYGAAQAVPGPLFTFAAYLGAAMGPEPNGIPGAALALVAIFLPGFLMTVGVLPFWSSMRSRPGIRAALAGVNATVVGILLAALYDPIITSAIRGPADVALALAAFAASLLWEVPPWAVVVCTVAASAIMAA